MHITSICVYCGSSFGSDPAYRKAAYEFGKTLAEHSITLVYGGGMVGLMGALADGSLDAGGNVTGVIPKDLSDKELGHKGISNLIIVPNMHERKKQMANLADAFVAMPGGIGTMEELFEVYTWKQLNFHKKPCAILNINGYYDTLIRFLEESVDSGFLKQVHLDALIVETDAETLLDRILTDTHVTDVKWQ
jgi:uncharacterized protein (TIGR00730 family)